MAVHLYAPSAAPGDAVTRHMLACRRILEEAGEASRIFASAIAPGLEGRVHDFARYPAAAGQVLLVQHPYAQPELDRLLALPDARVLVYHNVTPAAFFDATPHLAAALRLGREQLGILRPRIAHALAASNHNRRELLAAGYPAVDVLPPRTAYGELARMAAEAPAPAEEGPVWLFVGRVAPHKGHADLLRAFARYRAAYAPAARLELVGSPALDQHVEALRALAAELGAAEAVRFLGHVDDRALAAAYRRATCFVSLSRHEGFGVPLVEAMAAGVPVLARKEAAVPETLDGAGIMFQGADPDAIAALAHVVATDPALRARLIAAQHARVARLEAFDARSVLLGAVARARAEAPAPRRVLVRGAAGLADSLAIVNRGLARALDAEGGFEAGLAPGPGEPAPEAALLREAPELEALFARGAAMPYPDVAIANAYPVRVERLNAGLAFAAFAWEVSRVPPAIVRAFERELDGVGATSLHVKRALEASGATLPVAVVGNGVSLPPDFEALPPEALPGARRHRFLHVGSGFPRKGVDVLLAAYFEAFSGRDDVSLILKTAPAPEQRVAELLEAARARHPDPPHVLLIDAVWPARRVAGLYKAASAYVHAARAEGFGLPVAEAMLAGLPVVASASAGLADFCTPETAWTIPFREAPAAGSLALPGAVWWEPDAAALAEAMRALASGAAAGETAQRARRARALVAERYGWRAVAERWEAFIDAVGAARRAAACSSPANAGR